MGGGWRKPRSATREKCGAIRKIRKKKAGLRHRLASSCNLNARRLYGKGRCPRGFSLAQAGIGNRAEKRGPCGWYRAWPARGFRGRSIVQAKVEERFWAALGVQPSLLSY